MNNSRRSHRSVDVAADRLPFSSLDLVTLQRLELEIVRRQAAIGRHPLVRPFTLLLNHLGNGWLYPLLTLVLWLVVPPGLFAAVVLSAGVSVAIAHIVYPRIKKYFARPRPFDVDPEMTPMLPVLDRYSFPSGHCMTITAVTIPMVAVQGDLLPWAIGICLLIAWGRMLAAHHYLSDLLAGVALGALASLPAIAILV